MKRTLNLNYGLMMMLDRCMRVILDWSFSFIIVSGICIVYNLAL